MRGVNSVRKRITLAFRGSVSRRDYEVDFNVRMKEIPNPSELQGKRVHVHSGFEG